VEKSSPDVGESSHGVEQSLPYLVSFRDDRLRLVAVIERSKSVLWRAKAVRFRSTDDRGKNVARSKLSSDDRRGSFPVTKRSFDDLERCTA
jgi:hypothetical protein